MTQQRSDGAPSADAANAYLEALRERLAADGCGVTATTWRDYRVVIGSRSDRKVRWFGTRVELFVLATAVLEVDNASMAEYTGWAMDYVKSLRSGLPGARNAAMILPALASGSVQPSARDWAAKDARILGTSLIGRPVTVETSASKATRVSMYRGRVVYGGMFTRHVLKKASLYFP
ncbi:hypothetical protein OG819_56460 [Streptomyces sp. NBC_01549]|uniref:hypothetical protein n=1 Tax=Streptomyces sp. NBC_01549 TaxID=2975874 RepID=UPI00224D3837|nr:hypothetical protein [Streptomyces sp. NBC_01549]MCX4598532.1 hypothetical protein [Streptomyces sp. NBC_01549]